jgi:hypothetical protein
LAPERGTGYLGGAAEAVMLWIVLLACKNENDVSLIREPPQVHITSPANGDIVIQRPGDSDLQGVVSDLPDAAETLAVQWTIDDVAVDSPAADGDGNVVSLFQSTALSIGEHRIVLAATDSDGNTVTDEISIEIVAAASPPTVQITAPADFSEFELGTEITFTGTASDANDAPDDLTLAWQSSIDGALAGATSGGGLTFVNATLTEGVHTIYLTATDLDGEVGTDTITVTIGEPEQPTEDPEPGEVIFSELMVNPGAVDDEVGEWVELYNTGGRWLDIGGYGFHDLDYDWFELTGSIPVPPNGYVVLCANVDVTVNGGAPCDGWFERLTSGGLALANVPDEVVLTRPDGTEIDRLEYADAWVAEGAAIGLDPGSLDGTANDDFGNWCFQTSAMSGGDLGTPGAENDTCP